MRKSPSILFFQRGRPCTAVCAVEKIALPRIGIPDTISKKKRAKESNP
jgi:hypothetical protein